MPPEQFLGRRIGDIFPADLSRDGMLAVGRAIDGSVQVWRYDVAGRSFEARIVASGPDEVVSFVRDVTPA